MDELILRSEKETVLSFHSRRINGDGWVERYVVSAAARNFSASIEVENPPYGTSPDDLFAKLADNWSGWKGKKEWGAIEGEFNLVATTDSLGHITLSAELNPNGYPPCWSGTLTLVLDAGSLEEIANHAKMFFSGAA